jgi:hypothetical protein
MALPNVSAHPVNISAPVNRTFKELNFRSLPGSRFQPPAAEEESDLVLQSLRLQGDERFQAIRHYRDTRSDDKHFEELMKKHTVKRVSVTKGMAPVDSSFTDVAEMELSMNKEKAGVRCNALADRIKWQEAFDKSVNQLLIDFDLTHEPSCRLNHLDRMHHWFLEHGGKQQRKAKKAPSYLTADRTASRMPAGSTRDVGGKLGGTSQLLAGSYVVRGKSGTFHADGSQTAR